MFLKGASSDVGMLLGALHRLLVREISQLYSPDPVIYCIYHLSRAGYSNRVVPA